MKRKSYYHAVESIKRAKQKYEELFLLEELAEVAHRESAYMHTTK